MMPRARAATSIVVASASSGELGWADEPTKLEDLTTKYELEAKVSGRHTGTSLFIVKAKDREGATGSVVPEQSFKLFLAPWLKHTHHPKPQAPHRKE